VRNISKPVIVQFGLGLIKMDLLEKENMLFLSTWTRYVSLYLICSKYVDFIIIIANCNVVMMMIMIMMMIDVLRPLWSNTLLVDVP